MNKRTEVRIQKMNKRTEIAIQAYTKQMNKIAETRINIQMNRYTETCIHTKIRIHVALEVKYQVGYYV